MTKIMANATTLKFTHATTSNHEYPEDLNIKELKELEGIRQTTDAPSAQIESENVVGVKALFENAKVEESYYIWNIGLYAESEDGEILFAVCQAQTPDQMPAFKGVAPSAYIYDIRLAISQASSLTIVVNPSGTVTMQDLIELEKKKVSIQGGDISDTVINIENPPDEDKNPVKYPEIGDSGTTKSIMGQIRRWLKSLKEDKVDKKGGDVSDTVVSGLTDSTASFPQPTAGDSQETLWGKVKKWQQDCLIKFGNYVLMSMITNQHLNSTSNIPTSALVYLMQQAIQQNQNAINVLNTKQIVEVGQATPWGAVINEQHCTKYGNHCDVYVRGQVLPGPIPIKTSLFSLPWKIKNVATIDIECVMTMWNNTFDTLIPAAIQYDGTYGTVQISYNHINANNFSFHLSYECD
ncbi:MAG: hypothetical protein ACLSX5_14635 [Lachnospiraceae bacterium]